MITAGLGIGNELRSLYPDGLDIGTIAQVKTAEAAAYDRAIITPAVDLRRLEHEASTQKDVTPDRCFDRR